VGTLSGEILKMPLDVPEKEEKVEDDPTSTGAEVTKLQFLDSVGAEQVGVICHCHRIT
jgi:hypothetical protein